MRARSLASLTEEQTTIMRSNGRTVERIARDLIFFWGFVLSGFGENGGEKSVLNSFVISMSVNSLYVWAGIRYIGVLLYTQCMVSLSGISVINRSIISDILHKQIRYSRYPL